MVLVDMNKPVRERPVTVELKMFLLVSYADAFCKYAPQNEDFFYSGVIYIVGGFQVQISDNLLITEEAVTNELESLNITKTMRPVNSNPRALHVTSQPISSIMAKIVAKCWQSEFSNIQNKN